MLDIEGENLILCQMELNADALILLRNRFERINLSGIEKKKLRK